ncbi:hypothetical protein SLS60_004591 [Paraconiothyrium brasiliense]|uniref:Uncharacterized protein n=1 Tax=Paraconiothyrium brasiliense TaxID=300254 RepID=A0ABR3RKS6_9PLEO
MVYERIPVTTKTYGASLGGNRAAVRDPKRVRSHGGLMVFHETLPTSILRVSKTVYYEARPIVRTKLKFIITQPVQVLLCVGPRLVGPDELDSITEMFASPWRSFNQMVEPEIMRRVEKTIE